MKRHFIGYLLRFSCITIQINIQKHERTMKMMNYDLMWEFCWPNSIAQTHTHTLSRSMIKHLTFYSKYNCLRATTHNPIGQKSRLFAIENSTSNSIIFDRMNSQRKQIAFRLRIHFWLLFRNRDRVKERDRKRWRKTFKENCFVDLQAVNNRYFDFV